jgi:hypothetical protein
MATRTIVGTMMTAASQSVVASTEEYDFAHRIVATQSRRSRWKHGPYSAEALASESGCASC